MVDNVGKFISKHFPEAKVGAKIDVTNNDALKHTIFLHSDTDNDKTLNEQEVKNIDNSRVLEGEEKTKFLANKTINLKDDGVDKVVILNNGTPKAIVSLKKTDEQDTPNLLIYDVSDMNNPVNIEHRYFDDKGVEIVEKFNPDGSKTIKEGNVTTEIDSKERVTSIKVDNGNKGVTEVKYEYNDDDNIPVKQTTIKPDGTKEDITEDIINPNEDVLPQEEEESQSAEKSAAQETQVDRSKPLYAKNGESFLATAKRLFGDENLTKDDPRYKALAAANPKAAQKGWFVLSNAIVVPEDIKEKVADEAFGVDKKEQEKAYINFAQDKIKDKVEEFKKNTDEITLDKSTSWWMLAKKNLQDVGIQNPTNKQIYERIGVLTALNEGKEPVAGTKFNMPKVADVEVAAQDKETTETKPEEKSETTETAEPKNNTQELPDPTNKNNAATMETVATQIQAAVPNAAVEVIDLSAKYIDKLKELKIPEDVINRGDTAIKKYAKEHNITLPKKE